MIDNLEHALGEGELLAFFYCDFRSERSTAAAEVMRSLLFQLLRGFGDLGVDPGDILGSLDKEKRRNGSILSHAKRLALVASRAAKQFARQPFIVIDALDECKDIENLLDAILVLKQGGMRLFVISRPLQVIKENFSGFAWLSLENMSRQVSADIDLHVTRELDSNRRLRIAGAALKKEITRTLCDKADGMLVALPCRVQHKLTMLMLRFRWIQCQLDTLKRCVTAVKIREVLGSLPIGLEATYERILLAMNKEEGGGRIARHALVWLVAALAPLRLSQIVEALSIDLDQRTLNPDVGPIHGHALLDTLGSLVTHDESTDIVKLSHFSVKVYHFLVSLSHIAKLLDRNTLWETSDGKNTVTTSTNRMLTHRLRGTVWLTWQPASNRNRDSVKACRHHTQVIGTKIRLNIFRITSAS